MQTPTTLHNPTTAARFVHHLSTHPKVNRHPSLRDAMSITQRSISDLQAGGEQHCAERQLRGLLLSLDMSLALPTAPDGAERLRHAIDASACGRRCAPRSLIQRVDALLDAAAVHPEVVDALVLHAPLQRATELARELRRRGRSPRPKRQFLRALNRLLRLLHSELGPAERAQVLAPFAARS